MRGSVYCRPDFSMVLSLDGNTECVGERRLPQQTETGNSNVAHKPRQTGGQNLHFEFS